MKRIVCLLLPLLLLCGCAKKTAAPETGVCTVSVCCDRLSGNDKLNPAKRDFVPSDGYILRETRVAFREGETVFDVLRRACTDNVCTDRCKYCQTGGIQLEFAYTPAYGAYYVEGIHNLYEKDCGSTSGWLFFVNGESATRGCSEVAVQDGDRIEWVYTTDLS